MQQFLRHCEAHFQEIKKWYYKFTVQYKTAPVPCQGRVDQVDEEEGERDDEEQDGPVAVDSAGRMSRKVEPLR